jgi:hypothetical protein
MIIIFLRDEILDNYCVIIKLIKREFQTKPSFINNKYK